MEGLEVESTDFDSWGTIIDLDFAGYSKRVFGLSWHGEYGNVWDFIFSDFWTGKFSHETVVCPLENTPQATADRIRIVTSGLFKLNEQGYENK